MTEETSPVSDARLATIIAQDPTDASVIDVDAVIHGLVVGLDTPLDTIGVRNAVAVQPEVVRLAIKLLTAARRRLGEMEADAERYRWLRDNKAYKTPGGPLLRGRPWAFMLTPHIEGPTLDIAIDRARDTERDTERGGEGK